MKSRKFKCFLASKLAVLLMVIERRIFNWYKQVRIKV